MTEATATKLRYVKELYTIVGRLPDMATTILQSLPTMDDCPTYDELQATRELLWTLTHEAFLAYSATGDIRYQEEIESGERESIEANYGPGEVAPEMVSRTSLAVQLGLTKPLVRRM